MRPTFMGFETAKRGLMINQKSLDIVSHNLGNIGVTGYTRQRVDQASMSLNGTGGKYGLKQSILAGQGAQITGVSQVRDSFLDKRFRQEYSDVGYYNRSSEVLADLETALDEYGSDGLKSALSKLNNSLSTLQGEINPTNANILRTSAKSLTETLKQFDNKLNNIMEQQKYNLDIDVEAVNSILERISNLNESIRKDVYSASGANDSYFGPNELLDARNVLVDQLSEYGDITTEKNKDGTMDIYMGQHQVIKDIKHETVSYVKNHDNTVSVTWQSNGEEVAMDSGSIKASLNMINGRGSAATGNENYERGIPYYKDKIDIFARTFVQTFNNTLPEFDKEGNVLYEKDADGNDKIDSDGKKIPVYKTLFTFSGGIVDGAGSIKISDVWNDKPNFILAPQNKDGVYDNKYYQNMLNNLSKDVVFGEFKGTMENYVKFYNTTLGEDKAFHDSRLTAVTSISEQLLDNISQVSGVSMDEEGADMMAYTKAYNSMSRVMTALDEALDTLINKTGLVGR